MGNRDRIRQKDKKGRREGDGRREEQGREAGLTLLIFVFLQQTNKKDKQQRIH